MGTSRFSGRYFSFVGNPKMHLDKDTDERVFFDYYGGGDVIYSPIRAKCQ
ncbi:hypothetical protein [Thermaurantimonas sp.]